MDEGALRKVFAKLGIPVLGRSQQGWLQARCPLAPWTHEKGTDRKPAFAAMVDEGGPSYYRCLACHHKGRMSQLVRRLESYTGRQMPGLAIECDIADASGAFGGGFEVTSAMLGQDEATPIDENVLGSAYPKVIEERRAMAYLQRRGISQATAELLDLHFDPDDVRILFPVRGAQRELYGFTGRSILEEHEYPYKGYPKIRDYLGLPKRLLLLGRELWQPGKPAFAVEGLFGYASLVQQGVRKICNPLAIMGSEMTQAKAGELSVMDCAVYLMSDDDQAGMACLFGAYQKETGDFNGDGAIRRLRSKGVVVFVPEWPEGKSDPDQLTYDDVEDILERCPMWMD